MMTAIALTWFLLASILAGSQAEAHVTREMTWNVNGFTFTKKNFNWKGEDAAWLEVSRNGKKLLRRQAHEVWVWTRDTRGEFVEAEDGRELLFSDLNGDGVLDFVVRQWSGGAYCCYTYEVFSLDPKCRRLWHIDGGRAHLKILPPQPRTGSVLVQRQHLPTLAVEDDSFLQWRTHTVSGPRPIVYLTWQNNGFRIDEKQQLKPVDEKAFDKIVQQPWSDDSEAMFIDLFYTGHAAQAVTMLDKLPENDREEFKQSFCDVFSKSQFYYPIVALNRGCVSCAFDNPKTRTKEGSRFQFSPNGWKPKAKLRSKSTRRS
jgi:hypothetical protein